MLWSYQMRSRAIVKFTPPNLSTTRRISDQDIAGWFSSPDRLVEKCFISTEMVCRIFYVDDYSVKKRKGPQYDVLYEDLGFDEVQTLDRGTLLGMLTDELVTKVLLSLPSFSFCHVLSSSCISTHVVNSYDNIGSKNR